MSVTENIKEKLTAAGYSDPDKMTVDELEAALDETAKRKRKVRVTSD